MWVQLQMECLHRIPPYSATGNLWRRRQKEFGSQKRWRTGEQGKLDQLSLAQMNSQRLKQQARAYTGPHPVLCAFMGLLSVNEQLSHSYSCCWDALLRLSWWLLLYLILFYYHSFLKLPLRNLFFFNELQKGNKSEKEEIWGGTEKNRGKETVFMIYCIKKFIFNKRKTVKKK